MKLAINLIVLFFIKMTLIVTFLELVLQKHWTNHKCRVEILNVNTYQSITDAQMGWIFLRWINRTFRISKSIQDYFWSYIFADCCINFKMPNRDIILYGKAGLAWKCIEIYFRGLFMEIRHSNINKNIKI